jgi:hypothetical protein
VQTAPPREEDDAHLDSDAAPRTVLVWTVPVWTVRAARHGPSSRVADSSVVPAGSHPAAPPDEKDLLSRAAAARLASETHSHPTNLHDGMLCVMDPATSHASGVSTAQHDILHGTIPG